MVHKEEFDTAYMRALYDYGYQPARKGYRGVRCRQGWQRQLRRRSSIIPRMP